MKLYSLFLLLGLILCDDGYEDKTYHFYGIDFNIAYNVDVIHYEEGYLPSNHTYFFAVPVSAIEEVVIELTTRKTNIQPFNFVSICGYTFQPTLQDLASYNGELCKNTSEFKIKENTDTYDYEILFSIIESLRNSIQYMSVSFKAVEALPYLMVYAHGPISVEPKIYDISYKKEFELNSTDLQNKIFIFKTIYEKEANGIIQLKTNKNFYPDYEFNNMLFGYIDEPKTMDDFETKHNNSTEPVLQSVLIEGNYSTFTFPYEKFNGSKYLALGVGLKKTLDYLSVYIGPKKIDEYDDPNRKEKDNINPNPKENENNSEKTSMPIWLIILIAVLYTVVLLVVFYFILRKCGYSKKGETSNEITKDFALQPDN